MRRPWILATALALCAAGSLAQGVTGTVTPRPAGRGARMSNQFCNNSGFGIMLPSSAPWVIRDQAGNLVFAPIGLPVIIQLPNGQCRTFSWDQRDNGGNLVAAGFYLWEVSWIDWNGRNQLTQTCFEITLSGVIPCAKVIAFPVGCPVRMTFVSPADGGLLYVAASSLGSAPGIALDPCRVIPLNLDGLFLISLCGGGPVFNGYCGTLSATGTAPAFVQVPNAPALAGVTFHTSFVTLEPGGAVRSIAASVAFTLGPPAPACPCP